MRNLANKARGRFRVWLAAASFACLPAAASCADPAAWADRADTVFQPVARNPDLPTVLLPTHLTEDSAGFLWGSGETGLIRWDGYQVRHYSAGGARPDGLRDHYVWALHRDAQGTLWAGTAEAGLYRHDQAADRFIATPLSQVPGAAAVWTLSDDGAGGLWAGTDAGLFRLDRTGHVVASLHHNPADGASLPDDKVQIVLCDRRGTLWVGGRDGLARRPDGAAGFTRMVLLPQGNKTAGLPQGDRNVEVSNLLQDSAGRLWIGTRQQGAFVLDPGAARARPVLADGAADEIMAMAEIAPGQIWLGTFGHGILAVDAATLAVRHIQHDPLVPNSLDNDNIYALYRDPAGLVWVSTTAGISLHNPSQIGILPIYGTPGRADRLTIRDATQVLARPDGTVWVGSQTDGVQILDATGKPIGGVPLQRIFAMAAAPTGPVFLGTRGGLYWADSSGRLLGRLNIPGRRDNAAVFSLAMLGGTLWLGGGDDGLWGLRVAPNGAVTVRLHLDATLSNSQVRDIATAPDGRLAIGTDNGVDWLDLPTGRLEKIEPDPTDPAGLGDGHVEGLLTDRRGRLWIGTANGGIHVLTGRDRRGKPIFRQISVAQGLPNADIDRMLPDRLGRIWASTDNGLAVIDPDNFAVTAWRRADGVAITNYWNHSGDVTARGELLFGGLGGITVVRPETATAWHYAPPLVVTGIRIGRGAPDASPAAAADPGWLTLPPGAGRLAVEFAALDYSAPDRNLYQYRLEGFDLGWVHTDAAHRVAAYTNLSPGDYTLRIAGSNRNGEFRAAPLAVHIRVVAAWYQTLWFYLACACAGAGLIGLLVQGRTVLLRQRQRELERVVAHRTAELSQSQAQLRQFAYVDSLTGLPNRRAFHEQLAAMPWTSPAGHEFAVLLIDLDGFKRINDTLGHDAGDIVLTIAARRLRNAVREGDVVCRLGGDEFTILLPGVQNKADAEQICQRIVTTMAEPLEIKGAPARIGASVGVALFPPDGQDAEQLYKHADLALYEAKGAGKGVWRWYRAA